MPHPEPESKTAATEPLICRRCGAQTIPLLSPGTGPYAFRSNYPYCGGFMQWVSKYTPEERARRQAAARLEAMARLAPTVAQIEYLKARGDRGTLPANRAEASERINHLTRAKGA